MITKVEYRVCSCHFNLFLNYAANSHTHIHIQADQFLKMRFLDSGNLKTCKSFKISVSKILHKNNTFSTICGKEK